MADVLEQSPPSVHRFMVACPLCARTQPVVTNQLVTVEIIHQLRDSIGMMCGYVATMHHDGVHDRACAEFGCFESERLRD